MNHSPLPQPVITSLTLGPVELTVSALDRSVAFYQQVLGLTLLSRDGTEATLGLPERPLVALQERPGALPVQPRSPGLYHLALLLPSRADLSRWVQHAARLGLRLGQADHLVSEAFYLSDPDGHGIEVYRDRPSSEWRWQGGEVEMAGDPIDLDGLLTEPGADVPFTSLPDGTTLGHVHLRVADLAATEAFYAGVLGFDIVSRWPGALFVSVDGYHHHLGLNTWQSQGGALAPEGTSRLTRVTLTVKDIGALHSRLTAAGARFIREGDRLEVTDPAGNHLRIQAGGAA